jgi:glycosyltransferase involved in cell wall biosynthesis
MDWKAECAAVIPCLNEASTIGDVVLSVREHLPNVFVVDDGSGDGSGCAAQKAGATVLRHDSVRGKGAALTTGWATMRQNGFKWALTLDGDGQHSAADIPVFIEGAENRPVALVVGNRMESAARMPFVRRYVNRWMSSQLATLAGQPLPDSQCGFRLMNLNSWSRLTIETTHFEIESEVLLAFIAAGERVAFVPIRVIYGREMSKIHPVRDTLRWFRWKRRAKRMLVQETPIAPAEPQGVLRA